MARLRQEEVCCKTAVAEQGHSFERAEVLSCHLLVPVQSDEVEEPDSEGRSQTEKTRRSCSLKPAPGASNLDQEA